MMINKNVAIAQINTISGDVQYNANLILDNIRKAQRESVELVIFPELALTGIGLDMAIKRYPVIVEQNLFWLNKIAEETKGITVIVGFIDNNCKNSVAVIKDDKICEVVHKNAFQIVTINKMKYCIVLGELDFICDVDADFDAIINICAKYTTVEKECRLNSQLSLIAKKLEVPVLYVDLVGANDSFVFDGLSRVYNKDGVLIAKTEPFIQNLLVLDLFSKDNILNYESSSYIQECFSLDYEFDLERTYNTLLLGIKDYFAKTGFRRAVLGLSGGLDSTVCAVLLADALGAENVFGISMPSKLTSQESKSDAQQLAQNLGINFAQASIKDMVEVCDNRFHDLFAKVEQSWDCRYKQSFTMDNIQARSRAMYLWGISNEFGSCLPIATSDKSESYMGYATINGDMSGGIAPLADVTKTKLFALARWINKNRKQKNVIPESVILKKPGAELAIDPNTGKTLNAEDALMPYEFLDEIIWRVEYKNETYNQMLNSEFIYEKKENISKEQKTLWLEKFYKRMSTSHYKWAILPPAIITDCYSINPNIYSQLITSSKINYTNK